VSGSGESAERQLAALHSEDSGWLKAVPVALGAVLCVLYLGAEVSFLGGQLGLPLDDSWIHLQFARNLAEGEGLSYNPGEMVPGTTAPLWTAVLSLFFVLPGSPLLWAKITGAVLFLGGVEAARQLSHELDLGPGLAVLAAALTAATGWLVWAAMSGMEIPLFVFLSMWGMVLHIRERRAPGRAPLSLFLFGTAVLARPEGLLLLALAVFDRLVVPVRDQHGELELERPRLGSTIWGVLAGLIVIAPVGLFNLVFSGSALPTTFAAKSTGLERFLPNLQSIYKTLGIFFREQPVLTMTAVAGCLVLVERLGRRREAGLLPALWLLGLPVAYSTLGGVLEQTLVGNFGRYYFPLFPLLAVLGVLGLERAAAALGWSLKVGKARVPLGVLALLLVVWPTASGVRRGLGRYLQSVGNVQQSDIAMAYWLKDRLPADALLAVNDVGALKFLLPNRILDLAGIINPEVPVYMRQAMNEGRDWHQGILRFLDENRPDYLVIFPAWYPRLAQLDERFRVVYSLEIPQNITMGGNELAVYATPWTRYPLRDLREGQLER
jgi:hypothetical protein